MVGSSEGLGFLNLLLMGGASNRIDPNSAVVPAREGAVTWFQAGALWNEQQLEPQSLAFVDALCGHGPGPAMRTAQYGVPDRQLGSQLTTPPDLTYLKAYWSSPTHDFVPFLIGVKRREGCAASAAALNARSFARRIVKAGTRRQVGLILGRRDLSARTSAAARWG